MLCFEYCSSSVWIHARVSHQNHILNTVSRLGTYLSVMLKAGPLEMIQLGSVIRVKFPWLNPVREIRSKGPIGIERGACAPGVTWCLQEVQTITQISFLYKAAYFCYLGIITKGWLIHLWVLTGSNSSRLENKMELEWGRGPVWTWM